MFEVEPLEDLILPGEEWKNFPLSSDYQVSSLGRVKHPKGGILQGTNHHGYIRVRVANLG